MWEGYVESNIGEKLRIMTPNGQIGGKAALAFLNMLSSHCYNPEKGSDIEGVSEWFFELEKVSGIELCTILAPLEKCFYTGNWSDFTFDERDFFIKRNRFEVSQVEFEQTIRNLALCWTPIHDVIKSVQILIKGFQTYKPKATDFYTAKDTISDFEGMYTALEILQKRASTVRIRFEF